MGSANVTCTLSYRGLVNAFEANRSKISGADTRARLTLEERWNDTNIPETASRHLSDLAGESGYPLREYRECFGIACVDHNSCDEVSTLRKRSVAKTPLISDRKLFILFERRTSVDALDAFKRVRVVE